MKKLELIHIIREEIKLLLEKNNKDLRQDDPMFLKRRERSKQTPGSNYVGMQKNKTLIFKTNSHTEPGTVYTQKIRLKDLPKLVKEHKGKKPRLEIVKLATQGDIAVHCDCPAFKYWGFEYKAKKEDYGIHKQDKSPDVRNPGLKGSMCKHLDNVALVLPFNVVNITNDLRQQGIF